MNSVQVGLIGFGTIGAGVARILLQETERISQAVGKKVVLKKICDKDLTSDRGFSVPKDLLTSDISDILNDPEIEVVIELIGGLEPARSFVLRALESGKSVVTANKALLASHGPELFGKARECRQTIAFEAAVCGGIPILSSLTTSLQANKIESIRAIVNGTSNFILSQMEEFGSDYETVLKDAQKKGYAEANPSMDVDGTDAAQKLAILAQLAFRTNVHWKSIPRTGIEDVEAIDFLFAKELSYRIRLLAFAAARESGVELHISPTLIPLTSPLSHVKGAFNAVQVVGSSVGPVFYHGLGAGQCPTASAVVGDIIDTLLGRTKITFETLQLWNPERNLTTMTNPLDDTGRFYLRLSVDDRPGVLAAVAGELGRYDISIASMLQRESINETSQLVIMTYETQKGQLQKSIDAIRALPFVRDKMVLFRVYS